MLHLVEEKLSQMRQISCSEVKKQPVNLEKNWVTEIKANFYEKLSWNTSLTILNCYVAAADDLADAGKPQLSLLGDVLNISHWLSRSELQCSFYKAYLKKTQQKQDESKLTSSDLYNFLCAGTEKYRNIIKLVNPKKIYFTVRSKGLNVIMYLSSTLT